MAIKLWIFVLVHVAIGFASFCDNDKCTDDNHCQWTSPEKPTIVVKGTSGRLGNVLFSYTVLLTYKLNYGLEVYFPENKWRLLDAIFDNLEIRPAEEHVCNFKHDFKVFWDNYYKSKMDKIEKHILSQDPKAEIKREEGTGKILVSEELYWKYGLDTIVHGKDFGELGNLSMPEPWIVINEGDFHEVEKRNLLKGNMIYDHADNYDIEDILEIDEAIGLTPRLIENLKFKQKYLDMAQDTVEKSVKAFLSHFKKRKKRPILVGIHVRRGDHVAYEQVKGIPNLKASYFLEAMDKYRNHFGNHKVVFLVISDDISWCKQALSKGKNTKDLYFVTDKSHGDDGIGHDLAVMSLCQHSIISRGTFSYWSSFLTGGATILPCHFAQYRGDQDKFNVKVCQRDPLKDPLKQLYKFSY